ncbi:transketolase family protein [Thermodesulfovibrionales bacterium]|nr:transketolase family protein [Thermodesulfovibrionales bacterium]MCL0074711.1 transketolase family protein [Thermodesulfovibrionales bacterium]MCL0083024.1 transketolase family protein [Thermodesulfovibrionales bacterium]
MGGRKQGTEQKSQKTDFLGQAVATRNAYGIALLELGKRDGRIVVLDADLSGSTRTIEFANAFPDRFFNMGVSEQDMIGTAGGLSLTGKIPFASTFAVFETGRAWDQIRQTICYSNLNVKLVATHGGITVGEDGASHQALEDIALMRVLPNMTVIVPSDGFETKQVIDAVAEYDGPVYVRLGRGKVPAVMPEGYKFQIGKAYKFHAIHDTTIIANGIMVSLALKASEMLAKEGINAGVVNMSTVKPLDTDTLLEVAKNSKLIVTAEEHSIIGGLGSAVSEFLSENRAVLIKKVGVKDTFGCSGKPEELLKLYGLTADNIVKVVMESRA